MTTTVQPLLQNAAQGLPAQDELVRRLLSDSPLLADIQ